MMAGLALAETTPGPLVIVLEFVGFVGGWQNPGRFGPLGGASIGAAITVWTTFVPSFLLVFLGAPFVESLRSMPRLGASLTAITAAVVGVILNLGVVFSIHALWPGADRGFDALVAVTACAAFVAMRKFRVPFTAVLGACALIGFLTVFL
jgi:chromate transporter